MKRSLAVRLAPLLLLAACAPAPAWTPGPVVVISPTPATPTAATTPTAGATASGTAATMPDPAAALDVSAHDFADFASPTGRIWCGVHADTALCHFPSGMDSSKVPTSSKVCPGEHLDVTGVSVGTSGRASYFCSGDPEALPQVGSETTAWWTSTGFPSVAYDGFTLAVLPYDKAIAHAPFACLSARAGVTCANTVTGKGFTVARAGVTLIG
jgi:hypothetical protein